MLCLLFVEIDIYHGQFCYFTAWISTYPLHSLTKYKSPIPVCFPLLPELLSYIPAADLYVSS